MRRSLVFLKLATLKIRSSRLLAASGIAMLVTAGPLAAQTTTGMIRGYLRGQGGAPVAGGQVTARSPEMGISRGATANDEGFYSLAGLRPGSYTVEARRIGFQPQTRTIVVQIGQTIDANFDLTAAATQLAGVQVTATAPFETKTSEVATNVTQAQIQD